MGWITATSSIVITTTLTTYKPYSRLQTPDSRLQTTLIDCSESGTNTAVRPSDLVRIDLENINHPAALPPPTKTCSRGITMAVWTKLDHRACVDYRFVDTNETNRTSTELAKNSRRASTIIE